MKQRKGLWSWGIGIALAIMVSAAAAFGADAYVKGGDWAATMAGSRRAVMGLGEGAQRDEAVDRLIGELMRDYPVRTDWMLQDFGIDVSRWFTGSDCANDCVRMIERVLRESEDRDIRQAMDDAGAKGDVTALLGLYEKACEKRRRARLAGLLAERQRVVFTKHLNMGGSHYAYTEAESDAQNERSFRPGTSLCMLTMDGLYPSVETLIEDRKGVIRDPDVSYDGGRILFSWKKSDRGDDYHLYEMDIASRKVRQITSGLGFADYEGAYLPDGDIIFNSTRCVQIVDCWWTEVSNLYRCDGDGRFLRRLGFDQVHTNYPTVLADGRVIYTRWDYNDRGQIYPQPLYQMNPDGTGQREFYGNNSWFPTAILHARGIAGTGKVVAIASGHHCRQTGKLILIDPTKGRQENSGVQLIAPVRPTPAERIDAYGQKGELFQYPYPLSGTQFLVTYCPFGWARRPVLFGIYYFDINGRRELLATDARISCNQPVPVRRRQVPHVRPGNVDYSKNYATYYVQDIYRGVGLAGVERGTVKKLRVVEIRFRAAGIRSNGSGGPAGGALSSTPVSINNGCWDVKAVLGDAKVYEDGSACFNVPARTPVYFQAIDAKGRAAQSMRTWSTLQPGEVRSCVGCHESKDETPVVADSATMAMKAGPQKLEPFYGPARGFSFNREIQPILDRHCVSCHNGRDTVAAGSGSDGAAVKPAFSLLDKVNSDEHAGRAWSDSYLALTSRGNPDSGPVRWLNVQSVPPVLPAYYAGSAKSPLVAMLEAGHKGVSLSKEEMDKIACWIDLLVPYCGDYLEGNCWNDGEVQRYLHFQHKREAMEATEADNIRQLMPQAAALWTPGGEGANPYRNLAVNPNDVQGYARSWPHASSNSECRGEAAFAACNAINGVTDNAGHGPRFPSWGPDKRRDLWWKVDFGRMVEIDKLVLYIRADFPHDDYWRSATIEFSDGSRQRITIAGTADKQELAFAKRRVSWLRLTDLVEEEPLDWCGLTEVEVWGRDVDCGASPVIVADAQ